MKTIKQFGLMLTMVAATLLSSCSGDDNGGGGGSASLGTIVGKAGGKSFKTYVASAMKQATGSAYTIIITGSTADTNPTKSISLILNGVNGQPGTWEISEENTISVVGTYTEVNVNLSNPMDFSSTSWAAPYANSGVAGSITISEITDTNVKGTFNFTGKNQEGSDTKQVTNGAFNLNFQGS